VVTAVALLLLLNNNVSLNRCKGMEDQVGDFLKQLAAKLELVLLTLLYMALVL